MWCQRKEFSDELCSVFKIEKNVKKKIECHIDNLRCTFVFTLEVITEINVVQ